MRLTHLSLFTGIGGIDRAAEWAGFVTVGQCEFADYPTKVLEKHWPDVPRWRDIHDVTAESFRERTGLRTINLISGGFPCQPFSVAGNQKGKEDPRYLWPQMLRVIRELKPRWVLGENVPGILRIAGRTVCEDLEREGYDIAVFDFEASAVGASHRRERVFFVANAGGGGFGESDFCGKQQGRTEIIGTSKNMADSDSSGFHWDNRREQGREFEVCGKSETIPNSNNQRLQVVRYEPGHETLSGKNRTEFSNRRSTEPRLGRVADGLPRRMDGIITFPLEPDIPRVATGIKNRQDRIECLGNAVVPAQAYPILKAIAEMEELL